MTFTVSQLVHMFFGNEVTCDWWDNVWLNEGFASYLEYAIADKVTSRPQINNTNRI